MELPQETPFEALIEALLDVDTPLSPRFLYRLSDIEAAELEMLKEVWEQVPDWRRKALLEDVETLGAANYMLSFEALARFTILDALPEVRLPSIRTLAEYETTDLIELYRQALSQDNDLLVRAAAADALSRYVYLGEIEELPPAMLREIEQHLIEVIRSEDAKLVRRRALEALSYSAREEVTEFISVAYNSADKEWIVSAVLAMGRSANEKWAPQVLENLENSFPAIRAEAARAAGELELHEAVPQLLEMLDDHDPDVRAASIWSLSQIGGEGVQEALEMMYEQTDDPEEVELIEAALENLEFTENMQLFALFDFPAPDEDEDSEYFDIEDFTEEP
jgi:HEAT repeat protein